MEKSRDYVETFVSFKGQNRKIQISPDGYEVAKLPEHPATPAYTVVFQDADMIELIGADRIQIPVTDNGADYGNNPLINNDSIQANELIGELQKIVRKHHDVFNPEAI
ncbi:MAG: hypothetical protein EOP48_32200 [Sphingobacteriales bacterium]|nr:MAG: hypothetical protein EOP48_32200 [Sphingobacteriales bacterium]